MKSKQQTSPRETPPARPRSAILSDIASLGAAVRGTLSEKPRRLADGSVRVYHQLQRWENGRNRTIHVPERLVGAFKAATAEGRRLDVLADELSAHDTRSVLAEGAPKKNARNHRAPERGAAAHLRRGGPGHRRQRPWMHEATGGAPRVRPRQGRVRPRRGATRPGSLADPRRRAAPGRDLRGSAQADGRIPLWPGRDRAQLLPRRARGGLPLPDGRGARAHARRLAGGRGSGL